MMSLTNPSHQVRYNPENRIFYGILLVWRKAMTYLCVCHPVLDFLGCLVYKTE